MAEYRIAPEALAQTVAGILDEYGEGVMLGTRKAVDKTAKEMVRKTKETAPKRAIGGRPAGTFANRISSKVTLDARTGYERTWYVRPPEHALAHLLNNGHALHQGGRWEGVPFITRAAQEAATAFERRVKEAIFNAGQ